MVMRAGELIKNYRKKNSLTQKEFAGKAGIGQDAISHYETGVHSPNARNRRKLSDATGIPADCFKSETCKKPVIRREAVMDELHHMDMTQHQLAIKVGLSDSEVSKILNGKVTSPNAVRRIAMVLNMHQSDILM